MADARDFTGTVIAAALVPVEAPRQTRPFQLAHNRQYGRPVGRGTGSAYVPIWAAIKEDSVGDSMGSVIVAHHEVLQPVVALVVSGGFLTLLVAFWRRRR